jgi:small GTP-binding protein
MVDFKKKIVVAGAPAVGKTSLIRRYVEGTYDERYISTIGAVPWKKDVEIVVNGNSYDISLMLMDTNGTISDSLFQAYSKGADGVILVFDLTRRYTLKGITQKLVDSAILNDASIAVVGNKFDLKYGFEEFIKGRIANVYVDEGLKEQFNDWMKENHREVVDFFVKEYGYMPSFDPLSMSEVEFREFIQGEFKDRLAYAGYTSAKTGYKVEEMFEAIAAKTLEKTLAEMLE